MTGPDQRCARDTCRVRRAEHYDAGHTFVEQPIDVVLAQIRSAGWYVGVHNDYRLGSERFTFWLFTHETGRYVKGEGHTDVEALNIVLEAIE